MRRTRSSRAPHAAITEALGYIRVSTERQGASGLGLAAQRARSRRVLRIAGLGGRGHARGPPVGRDARGRGLQSRNRDATTRPHHRWRTKLDRLTRTAADLDRLTSMIQAHGGEWATVEGAYDTSTAMGRFMLRVVADIAQMEREVIAERTSAALQTKLARGEHVGRVPYGHEIGEDGRLRVRDDDQGAVVVLAQELRAQGATLRRIAAELNTRGIPSALGGRWAPGNGCPIVRR